MRKGQSTVLVIPRTCNVSDEDIAMLRKKGFAVVVADDAHLVRVLDMQSVQYADGVVFESAMQAIAADGTPAANGSGAKTLLGKFVAQNAVKVFGEKSGNKVTIREPIL